MIYKTECCNKFVKYKFEKFACLNKSTTFASAFGKGFGAEVLKCCNKFVNGYSLYLKLKIYGEFITK